jgi:hypothetical protein
MAEDISSNKKGSPWAIDFDTKIPSLGEDANIQDALKIFYFGNTQANEVYDTSKSIYQHFLTLESITESLSTDIFTHDNTDTNTHGIGQFNDVVGTGTAQTLTNKALKGGTTINDGAILTATSTELNILDGATLSVVELNKLDGVNSSTADLNVLFGVSASISPTQLNYLSSASANIQTQLNTKSPLSSPTFTGSVNLPDDTKFGGKRLFIQATQPLSANNGDVWIKIGS